MTNETVRWRFPRIEGIVVNNETGEWSDAAFHNELLDEDDQLPVVWHQAAPEDDVTDIAAWERWKNYLESGQDVGETLRLRALSESRSRIRSLNRLRLPMRTATSPGKTRSTGLFAGVDEEICNVLSLKDGKHLGQLKTSREIARGPVQVNVLVDLVRRLYGRVSCNLGDHKPSVENWRWKPQTDIDKDNESSEVVLERAVAFLAEQKRLKGWCNQIPVASGLINKSLNKRSAVDLARIADGRLDLYELKCKSDNPVFAAFEILQYGLAYLLCRINKSEFGYAHLCTMKVNELGLNVLAPRSYYKGFDLAWLQKGLDAGIRAVVREQLGSDFRASFQFVELPATERFKNGAEAKAACGVTPVVAPRALALVHAMSNLVPAYPAPGSA